MSEWSMTINPPKHLKGEARLWFVQVAETFEMEPHHLKLLQAAAEAWQRLQDARELIDRDGAVVILRSGQLRQHPAIAIERDSRIGFARLLRELALDVAEPGMIDTSRPPSIARRRR
jgi:P27 family predicted phage terminase small subunit